MSHSAVGDADLLQRAATVAAALRDEHDLEPRLEPYSPLRWRGGALATTLCIDDFSGIPFLDVPGAGEYQHRARLRASAGDLYAAVTPRAPGYERYCDQRLGMGAARFVAVDHALDAYAVSRGCMESPAFDEVVEACREAGSLLVHPYMGIECVWELARRLSDHSGVAVQVLAPPPPVTWIANDKLAFGRLVSAVLGDHWLVETHVGSGAEQLLRHLLALGERHPMVALKRRRCASATGNQVFSSAYLKGLEPAARLAEVTRFLHRTECDANEEVLAVAWELTDLSPSSQWWIPLEGEPRLDGIYEQILSGEHGVFVGSRPSTLGPEIERRLAEGGLAACLVLQSLGYVGRCSFDYLVVPDAAGEDGFQVRFTECNGRWGGTSTPMALVDRLIAGPRPPYRAQDFVSQGLVGVPFTEILAALDESLYDPADGSGEFLLYNVGPLREHGKLDVIALGSTQSEAEANMVELLPRRLGLS